MGEELLRVSGVSKKFGNTQALNNVSVHIAQGVVYALLGKNGAGKSTLINTLTGAVIPDTGEVRLGGSVLKGAGIQRIRHAQSLGVGVVYQELSVIDYLSVVDNVFLGTWYAKHAVIDAKKAALELERIFDDLQLHIDPHALLVDLAPPKRQLVEIAKAIIRSPRLLILDEPTSSLGMQEVKILFRMIRKMQKNRASIIYVSHRMSEIQEIADSIGIMRDGRLVAEVEKKHSSVENVVSLMLGEAHKTGLGKAQEERGHASQEPALKVENLRLRPKVADLSFTLYKGEVLGIAGLLGSGRTEILEAIAGLRSIDSGSVHVRVGSSFKNITKYGFLKTKALGIGFVSEERKKCGIVPNLSVEENAIVTNMKGVSSCSVIHSGRVKKEAARIIRDMQIKAENSKASILSLSGGNQQKVVIGKWFYAHCTVLLLDEPTRGIDIKSKTQIYTLVRNWVKTHNSCALVISSEIEELPLLCDRIVVLNRGYMSEIPEDEQNADALLMRILKAG